MFIEAFLNDIFRICDGHRRKEGRESDIYIVTACVCLSSGDKGDARQVYCSL